MLEQPGIRERCRRVAQQNFSMRDLGQPSYVSVYQELSKGAKA
jgi:hypothetical protein